MSNNYFIFHSHTDYSNLNTTMDSVTKVEHYIDRVKEEGMKGICFSEHGNLHDWVDKKLKVEEAGLKYVHGVEAYVTKTLDERVRDNYHVVLIAKSYEGVEEINYLMSDKVANNRDDGHFYYTPRITFDELINTSDNVITTSACLGNILNSDDIELQKEYIRFMAENKDRCFLEIQHHNVEDQKSYNEKLLKISENTGVRLIAGTDTHNLNEEYAEGREVLQKSKFIHFDNEDGWDLNFKSREELEDAYKEQGSLNEEVYMEAIDNTNVLFDMVEEFELDYSYKYPELYENSEEVLKKKIAKSIIEKDIELTGEVSERINEEFETMKKNHAIDYILLEEDYKSYCREVGIPYGFGRGSVTGSFLAYLLDITAMDSIKHDLNFSRFMNDERVSLCDVDSDFPPEQRDMVKDYLYNKEGLYCADIITFNTIAKRGAIRDVGRALEIPLDVVSNISSNIESNEEGFREEYPELFKYVDLLQGVIVSMGTHAAGVVVSPIPLETFIGTCTLKTSKNPVTQIDMDSVERLNLVKLDILGLDMISIIDQATKMAGLEPITPDSIDTNDEAVWKDMLKSTFGIFQWNTSSGESYYQQLFSEETIEKLKTVQGDDFDYMNLFSMGNGAIRPAGNSYRDALANGEFRDNGHEVLNEFLRPTLGYCIEENQIVNTVEGRKKIRDINVGDEVYSENGVNKVVNKFDNGIKEIIEVEYGRDRLKCTKDHEVLTQRGWVEAKDLTEKDSVAYRVGTDATGIYDKNKLRLIGWVLGDGGLTQANNIILTTQSKEVSNEFRKAVESTFPDLTCSKRNIKSRVNKLDLYRTNVKYINHSKKTHDFTMYLRELGLKHEGGGGVYSRDKFIPEFIFNLDREHLLEFMGAYTDTDSAIKEMYCPIIAYKTTSKQFAYDIKEIGRLLGYRFYITHDKGTDSYSVNGNNAREYLMDLYNYSIKIRDVYDLKDLELDRLQSVNLVSYYYIKKLVDKNGIKKKPLQMNHGLNFYHKDNGDNRMIGVERLRKLDDLYKGIIPKHILNDNIIWVPVDGVNDMGEKARVYDLEVEGEHNFTTQNIIVSNCIFQEDVMEFLHEFCGFTMGEADVVRRSFSNKSGTNQYIPRVVEGFVETMDKDYGVCKEEAEELIVNFIKVIEDASDYLFNKNHSHSYSYTGYVSGWLRYYYPLEYLAAFLNVNNNSQSKTADAFNFMYEFTDIEVVPIKFRYSKAEYNIDKEKNLIYKGIESIKFMNSIIADELYKLRDRQYDTFVDLLVDVVEETSCNTRQINILIELGFFSEFGGIQKLLDIYKEFQNGKDRYKKTHIDKTKETRKAKLREFEDKVKNVDYSPVQKVECELEHLGYAETTVKGIDPDIGIVAKLEKNRWGTVFIDLYRLDTGNIDELKIIKRVYEKTPIKELDTIKTITVDKKHKRRKIDGEWVKLDETEDILTKWNKVVE